MFVKFTVHNLLDFENLGIRLSTFTEMIDESFCQGPDTISPIVQDSLTNRPQSMVKLALHRTKTKVSLPLVTPHVFCSREILVAD